MVQLLKIGGPALGPEQHTFVRLKSSGTVRDIGYGQTIPVAEVEDAQGYLDRGQATVVESPINEEER